MKSVSKKLVLLATAFAVSTANAGYSVSGDYDWFNQIVNNTPATGRTVDVDVNTAGYKVALQTSYYGSISGNLSQWYPKNEIWTSIAVGPMVNGFAIIFTKVNSLDNLSEAKDKNLPVSAQELTKWSTGDSSYWESQGGITFYAGFGTGIVGLGTFAVASGGWANYLEKTGPNSVYVERAKMNIESVSLGGNIGQVKVDKEKVVTSAKGMNFEFNFEVPGVTEAFERFMAGDVALAMKLSKDLNSGVRKVADTNSRLASRAFSIGLATPFIPLFAVKSTKTNEVGHEEEITSTDEIVVKDYGVYKKTKKLRLLVAKHRKEITQYKGGVTTVTTGVAQSPKTSEKVYGQFKYSYQSDFGSESKLNEKIDTAKKLTGLINEDETQVSVPEVDDSLKYNQVLLEMNLSDEYIRELIGQGKASAGFLDRLQQRAANNEARLKNSVNCNQSFPGDDGVQQVDPLCQLPSVKSVFKKLRASTEEIRAGLAQADKKGFSQAMADFGKAVWSHPGVFSAIYEAGKSCGVELKFEVSGQRITRFAKTAKHDYKESCN